MGRNPTTLSLMRGISVPYVYRLSGVCGASPDRAEELLDLGRRRGLRIGLVAGSACGHLRQRGQVVLGDPEVPQPPELAVFVPVVARAVIFASVTPKTRENNWGTRSLTRTTTPRLSPFH